MKEVAVRGRCWKWLEGEYTGRNSKRVAGVVLCMRVLELTIGAVGVRGSKEWL